MSKQIVCKNCEFSCGAIKSTIRNGTRAEKDGFLCCHKSEKVKADKLFTGKTSPRWCPLKSEEAKQ